MGYQLAAKSPAAISSDRWQWVRISASRHERRKHVCILGMTWRGRKQSNQAGTFGMWTRSSTTLRGEVAVLGGRESSLHGLEIRRPTEHGGGDGAQAVLRRHGGGRGVGGRRINPAAGGISSCLRQLSPCILVACSSSINVYTSLFALLMSTQKKAIRVHIFARM